MSFSSPLLDLSKISPYLEDLKDFCSKNITRKYEKNGSSSLHVKSDKADEIIRKVQRLSIALKLHSVEGPKLLNKRVQSLGQKILDDLDASKLTSEFQERILRLPIVFLNIKNALQLEGSLFGFIYGILSHRISTFKDALSSDPENAEKIREILHIIPDFEKKIRLTANSSILEIDISDLLSNFDEKNVENLSQRFDIEMLKMATYFDLFDGKLYIPLGLFPHQKYINNLLENPDENVRLLAQLLYISSLYAKEIRESGFVFPQAQEALNHLLSVESDERKSASVAFEEYLKHENVAPCLGVLINKLKEYQDRKIPPQNLLSSIEELFEIASYVGENWRVESAEFYGLILKIEEVLSYYLSKDSKQLLSDMEHEGADSRMTTLFDLANKQARHLKFNWKNPLSGSSKFCKSKEEFSYFLQGFHLLDNTEAFDFMRKNKEAKRFDEIEINKNEKAHKIKSSHKKKQGKDLKKEPASIPCVHEEVLSSPSIQEMIGKIESEQQIIDTSSATDQKNDIGDITEEIIDEITLTSPQKLIFSSFDSQRLELNTKLHQRVKAWFESAESGLISHSWDTTHILDRDEMILRHRFPSCILHFAQNELFSRKTTSQDYNDRIKRESLIIIDGKKYILEAVFNKSDVLFHLYARPLKNTNDYISKNDFSSFYFPTIEESLYSHDISLEINKDSFTVKTDGNAVFGFEGHSYEIVFLNKN